VLAPHASFAPDAAAKPGEDGAHHAHEAEPIFALTIAGKVQSYLACGKPIITALDREDARVISKADTGIAVPSKSILNGTSTRDLADKLDHWINKLKPEI
jgi:hypothetical protein